MENITLEFRNEIESLYVHTFNPDIPNNLFKFMIDEWDKRGLEAYSLITIDEVCDESFESYDEFSENQFLPFPYPVSRYKEFRTTLPKEFLSYARMLPPDDYFLGEETTLLSLTELREVSRRSTYGATEIEFQDKFKKSFYSYHVGADLTKILDDKKYVSFNLVAQATPRNAIEEVSIKRKSDYLLRSVFLTGNIKPNGGDQLIKVPSDEPVLT